MLVDESIQLKCVQYLLVNSNTSPFQSVMDENRKLVDNITCRKFKHLINYLPRD